MTTIDPTLTFSKKSLKDQQASSTNISAKDQEKASRVSMLTRNAMNDAQRAFNTAFQGKLSKMQSAQLDRFNQIEDRHLARIGRPNLRYDLGDDIDEFTGTGAEVIEARARKITVGALGPFNLAAMDRRLNKQIDAQVEEHIRLQSKVDVERVFSFIGVRQLRLLRIEFCICAIENERFDASGSTFEPFTTEQILQQARVKEILRPDSQIPVGQTEEQMLEVDKQNEEETLLSLLNEAAEGGLTTPQFVDLIIRALYFSGTCPPKDTDEYQELEQGLRNLFSVVDADGSGLASWDEVVEYLNHIAEQKKAAESGQTQIAHITQSTMVKRGPCRKVWTGAERRHAALWGAQVNTTYDSTIFMVHPGTLDIDSKLSLPTQVSCCKWFHQRRHKQEFHGLVVGDITSHLYFIPCEEAGPQVPPKLPAKVSDCVKVSIGKTPTEVLFNHELSVLVITTTDGYVMTYNFFDLLELNTMAKPKFMQRVSPHEPISAAICIRTKIAVGTLTGDLIISSLIPTDSTSNNNNNNNVHNVSEVSASTTPSQVFSIGHPSKRIGGIKTLHFLPSANIILCVGDSPIPTAWLLSRITQHDPIAIISDERPNEKPHEAPVISFFSDPNYFPNRFFTVDKFGLIKEWEIGLLQCVGTGVLLPPTGKSPFGSSEISAVSGVFDLRRFGRMKGLDAPIHVDTETILLPQGTPNLAMGCFVFQATDHTLSYEKIHYIPIEEMRVKERARSSSSRIVCCQYHAETDKVVATLGCDMAFWQATDGRVVKIYDRLTHIDISAAYLDTTGQRVAYGTSDGRCYLYVLVGGKPPFEFKKTHDAEIVLAYCEADMCIFAAKNGRITSYSLTSTTRDIADAVCELHFTDLEFNVGSVAIVDGQCAVGDQFGRVTLFDMVQSAGKILTVMTHRKTLTGTLPPAAAAANAAYETFAMEEDKKRRKRRLEKKKQRKQQQQQQKKGGNQEDDDDDDEQNEEEGGNDDDDDNDDDDENENADGEKDKENVAENKKTQKEGQDSKQKEIARVEKHFHAQRMWESNKRMWEERLANQKSLIARHGRSERGEGIAGPHGKVCDRLVSLFHVGASSLSSSSIAGNVSSGANNNSNILKLGYIVVKDENGKDKRISTTVSRQIARDERKRKREAFEQKEAKEKEKNLEAFLRRKKGEKEPHEQELEANALVAQVTATTAGASEQIARIKEASDRLVYSIARPSYGEVITIAPILDFPCFAVSNACGDIFCTTFSCVEPANVELLRWTGSAPRSVVKTPGKSNVVCMTCMRHPSFADNGLTLITGDDLGCLTMWNLEDTMNFFFNPTTAIKNNNNSSKRTGSTLSFGKRKGTSMRKTASMAMTQNNDNDGGEHGKRRRRSTIKITGVDDLGDVDDTFFEDEDDRDDHHRHHHRHDSAISQQSNNVIIAATAKYFLEESELWLRAPRPQLLSCIQITKNNVSITSLNAIPERNVAVIATGDGKIQVISLCDNLASRLEAGAILGQYIPHKRFAVKPPIGFRKLPPNPHLLQIEQQNDTNTNNNNNNNNNGSKPAQLADLVLVNSPQKNHGETFAGPEISPTRQDSTGNNNTNNSHARWKKVQESILGKRIAWFHLTDDIIKKAAFEDEVSALQRQQKDSAGSPTTSKNNNSNGMFGKTNSLLHSPGKRGSNNNLHNNNMNNNGFLSTTTTNAVNLDASQTMYQQILHPDDDIQDDASWDKIVNELLGRNNNEGADSSLKKMSNSNNNSQRQSLALSGTLRPENMSSLNLLLGDAANLENVRDVFAENLIKKDNNTRKNESNNNTPASFPVGRKRPGTVVSGDCNLDDDDEEEKHSDKIGDDDEDDDDASRRDGQNNIDLNVVRWIFTDPSSTPKAISKKSVMQQVKLQQDEREEKRKREEAEQGGSGVFALTQNQQQSKSTGPNHNTNTNNNNNNNNKKRKKHVKGANAFEDDEVERLEKEKKAERKRKKRSAENNLIHHTDNDSDSGDDENRPFVVEVLRPRQISTSKFAEKLRWELEFAIEEFARFGSIPASPQSVFRQHHNKMSNLFFSPDATATIVNLQNEDDHNINNNNSSQVQDSEIFSFLQHLPRPPRLFAPQVNSALTMPCSCDIDVPIPPHGSTSEWIRESVENFNPFVVQGRLIVDDENDVSNVQNQNKNKNDNSEDDDDDDDVVDDERRNNSDDKSDAVVDDDKAMKRNERKANAEQQLKEEKAREVVERRKRKELWGTLENAEMFNKALVFESIQDPDKVKVPLPKKYRDMLLTPRSREKAELEDIMITMQRPSSANTAASARSNNNNNNNSPQTGRSASARKNRTQAEKDQDVIEIRRQEQRLQEMRREEEERKVRSKPLSFLLGQQQESSLLVDRESQELGARNKTGANAFNRKELQLSVRPFGGSVVAIRKQKIQQEQDHKKKTAEMQREKEVGEEFEHNFLEQSTPGWPLQPNALLTPNASREFLLLMKKSSLSSSSKANQDQSAGIVNSNENEVSEIIPSLQEQIDMVLSEERSSFLQSNNNNNINQSLLFQAQQTQRFSVTDIRKFNKEQRNSEKNRFKPLDVTAVPATDFDKKQEPLDQVYGRFNEKQAKGKLWNVAHSRDKGGEFSKILKKREGKSLLVPGNDQHENININSNGGSTPVPLVPSLSPSELQPQENSPAKKMVLSHLASTPIPEQSAKSYYQTPIVRVSGKTNRSKTRLRNDLSFSSPTSSAATPIPRRNNYRDQIDGDDEDDDDDGSLFLINKKSALMKDIPERIIPVDADQQSQKISSARQKTLHKQHQASSASSSSFVPKTNYAFGATASSSTPSSKEQLQQQQKEGESKSSLVAEISRGVLAAEAEKQRLLHQQHKGVSIAKTKMSSSSTTAASPMTMKDRKAKLQQVFGNRATPVRDDTVETFSLCGVKK